MKKLLGLMATVSFLSVLHGGAEVIPSEDIALEQSADTLLAQEDFAGAEALSRSVLERHPHSTYALLSHVKDLEALGRYDDMLKESLAAQQDDSNQALAEEWTGVSLTHLGRYGEAIAVLEKSLARNPKELATSAWLAEAYRKSGNERHADELTQALLDKAEAKGQTEAMDMIGMVHRQMKEYPQTVEWWERAAKLGDKGAAQGLAAAYSRGEGVPQDYAESNYWLRRSALDPYPGFPRLHLADKWIAATHGWMIVLILALAAALLPRILMGGFATLFGRGLTTDPNVHWSERARRSYPFQIFLQVFLVATPFIHACNILDYPASQLPLPRVLLWFLLFFIALFSAAQTAAAWERRFRTRPFSALQIVQNIFVILLVVTPTMIIFVVTARSLPPEIGPRYGVILALGLTAYLAMQFGGWVWLARMVRLIFPADAHLAGMAAQQALARNLPVPHLWILHWNKANAFAFPHANSIMFTDRAMIILNDEEIDAVLAHELAHVCEDRTTKILRLLLPLLLFPILILPMPWNAPHPEEVVAVYLVILVLFLLFQKLRRKMEERADTFGLDAEKSAGAYARALAKLYEDNLVPAVMGSKRMTHPNLYDRLVTAGCPPDYPRPKPASRWGIYLGFAGLALDLALLSSIWLLLF